ncbi:MAG: STAS domain-containing protein [Acidobacteriaceae bacterium]
MPLNLSTKFIDKTYVIHCAGAIVMGPEATSLEATLERCSVATTHLILNAAEVHRLDSLGLGLIVRFMTTLRKRGGDLRLAAPSPFVSELLKKTLLDSVFQTYSTQESALNSYLKKPLDQVTKAKRINRILLIDASPDLSALIRTVLTQHGFDIQSTGTLRDAKVLLHSNRVDYILIGPSNSHITSEIVHQNLGTIAPTAITRHLSKDFTTLNAQEATAVLLKTFGITPPPTT